MERLDQNTIRNPPHQIRPRCVYRFLDQFASTRASIWTSEEEGLFIACVAGVESGRGLRGMEKGGGEVVEMGREFKALFPVALFSLMSYPSSFCAYHEG